MKPLKDSIRLEQSGNDLEAAKVLAGYLFSKRKNSNDALSKTVRMKFEYIKNKLHKKYSENNRVELDINPEDLNEMILVETIDGNLVQVKFKADGMAEALLKSEVAGYKKIHVKNNYLSEESLLYVKDLWGAEIFGYQSPEEIEKKDETMIGSSIDICALYNNDYLSISGWIVADNKIKEVQIYRGDLLIGKAVYGKKREDVIKAKGYREEAVCCGFYFLGKSALDRNNLESISLKVLYEDSFVAPTWLNAKVEIIEDGLNIKDKIGDLIKYSLDSPIVQPGTIISVDTKIFTIAGWAIGVYKIKSIEVFISGEKVGKAYHGIKREDVATAFPEFSDILRSGFVYNCNVKKLNNGKQDVTVLIIDQNGNDLAHRFGIFVDKQKISGPSIELLRPQPYSRYLLDKGVLDQNSMKLPLYAICIKGRDSKKIDKTIRSLWKSSYTNFVIFTELSKNGKFKTTKSLEGKIFNDLKKLHHLAPDFISFVDAGDIYAQDALITITVKMAEKISDIVVFDDNRYVSETNNFDTFLKPGWSPNLLESTNYIGNAYFLRSSVLNSIEISPNDLMKLSNHPRILLLTARCSSHEKVNEVLFEHDDITDLNCPDLDELKAIYKKIGRNVELTVGYLGNGWNVKNKIPEDISVSIIIPSIGSRGLVEKCISSIRKSRTNVPYEIIIVDNHKINTKNKWLDWFKNNADIVVEDSNEFNWSRLNNNGARSAKGDYLLFLNDDIEIDSEHWLENLIEPCMSHNVWLVGCLMTYPDNKLQHAGMFLTDVSSGRHSFRYTENGSHTYFNLAYLKRNVSAVTGACILVEKRNFDEIGGFNESHAIINNDLDFCLKVLNKECRIVYTPHVRLVHHEMASRESLDDVFDDSEFGVQWSALFGNYDFYYHPKLSKECEDYEVVGENLRVVVPPYPIFEKNSINNILALKLDHIGDAITSVQSIKLIKNHFPDSKLTVLCGKWAKTIFEAIDEVDEVLVFNFFNSQSGLGREQISPEILYQLEMVLKERFYDIAIDLRKVHDTRHILKLADARYSCGFKHDKENNWLDISLEWEKDLVNYDKKTHVSCDLINLVNIIGCASIDYRHNSTLSVESKSQGYGSKRVCVHPWSGNALRQWPIEYFAELADLLANVGLEVFFIGSENEIEVGNNILSMCKNKNSIFSKIGKIPLAELKNFILSCSFFVGNNSGPSHISSSYGVPTLSIHSGVISSEEWAPYGFGSFAVRCETECAPCYREAPGDCHRDIACLRKITPHYVFEYIQRYFC